MSVKAETAEPVAESLSRATIVYHVRVQHAVQFCLFLFLTIGAASLTHANQTLVQMYHSAWTVRDGAPTNIEAIAQTPDGYLWLGTDNGLFRFDGKRFEHFKPNSGEDLLPGIVRQLQALPDGGLWVGYPSRGASYIKDGHNTNYGPNEGLTAGSINQFAEDQDGTIWAASSVGLLRLENSVWKKIGTEWNYPASVASMVFVDHRGTLWVGGFKKLYSLPKGARTFHLAENAGQVSSITEAPNGAIWISIPDKPVCIGCSAPASLVKQITSPNGDLILGGTSFPFKTESILFGRDGSLWIGSIDEGVFRIPFPDSFPTRPAEIRSVAEHFSRDDGLTSNYVYSLMQDREGSIWMSSENGIDQFRPAAFTAMEGSAGFNRTAILADGSDRILVGSVGSTTMMRATQGKPKVIPNGPKYITCLYRDWGGKIWVGTEDGLWEGSAEKFTRQALPKDVDPSFHIVQSMTMDATGVLWVSILHSGVVRFSQGVWTHGENLTASAHDPALILFTDSSGRVWIGNKGNRIDLVDNGKITHFGPETGLDVGDVIAIYERGGQIWIGGESGFGLYRDGRFWHMALADNALPKGVSGIVQTANGDLWLNQASGVIHIAASEVVQAQSDKKYRARFKLYDYLDGINTPVHQIRPVPTAIQTDDGKLYFGMRSTVVWTDPDHIGTNPIRPSVFITSIVADGNEYKDPSALVLPSRTQNLEINYTALSLLIPERVQFRYLLEGIDKDWQEAATRRQALYSRLPPGEYKFRVIASNNDGLWNEVGAGFTFTVPPSFTQSSLFKTLCVLSAIALLWLIYLMRARQLTRQVQARMYERLAERERIARDLHDSFFQGIQGLLLRFHTATSQLRKDEPARGIFENALRKSDDVMREGRELLLDLRSTAAERKDLPNVIAEAGRQFQEVHPCAFKVIINGEPRALHSITWEDLSQIGREALGNAFRHSQAHNIEAEINYEPNQLRLRIRDDGQGIDPGILEQGHRGGHWGLPGMRERAKEIGAHIDVWSQSDAGTEVELKIPARLAYASTGRTSPTSWFRRLWNSDTSNERHVSN